MFRLQVWSPRASNCPSCLHGTHHDARYLPPVRLRSHSASPLTNATTRGWKACAAYYGRFSHLARFLILVPRVFMLFRRIAS